MSPEALAKFRSFADAIFVVPQAEKLKTFEGISRRVAGIVSESEFPLREAADLLENLASAHGLTEKYGDDGVQEIIAAGFADPELVDGDGTVTLDRDDVRPPDLSDDALA